jgi:signal transduction histidine kinase
MVGHELRNPLAPIATSIVVLREAVGGDRTVSRTLDIMERQTRQLATLVEDLLDVSRMSAGKLHLRASPLDLTAVARHAAETLQAKMDRFGHVFSVAVPPDPIWITGDETRLTQVIANLLDNAAKYTPPGGRIELAVEQESGTAIVRVKDNGNGMPGALLPHVFDLFRQAAPAEAEGLGIGLYVVKGLVEMHGGEVSASSAGPGKGSTFEVRLPVSIEPAATVERTGT